MIASIYPQYMYESEQRELIIMKYVREHQGSTKADITRGLKGIISKKTISRLVNGMIETQIVEIKKEKGNTRNLKLYLKEDNLLVSVTLQLDEFEKAFEGLLYYVIENIKYIRTNKIPDKSTEKRSAMDDANFFSLLQCVTILDRISNVYTVYAVIEWPKKMQSEEDLRSFIHSLLTNLHPCVSLSQITLGKRSQTHTQNSAIYRF